MSCTSITTVRAYLRESSSLGCHFESLDATATIEYALARAPGMPLGLIGYFMGAAVAVMSAAQDELGKPGGPPTES